MRFYEYEAREIVKRAGIPVTDYEMVTDPAKAKEAAARIGGSTVMELTATNEAQKTDVLSVDGFAVGAKAIVEAVVRVISDGAPTRTGGPQ